MKAIQILLILALLTGAQADYTCLCAYAVETNIYSKPDISSKIVGYMYEFDCKPVYKTGIATPGFTRVASEHQVGYVANKTTVQLQECQGNVPTEDKVTTTSPTSTIQPASTTVSTAIPLTHPITSLLTKITSSTTASSTSTSTSTTASSTASTTKLTSTPSTQPSTVSTTPTPTSTSVSSTPPPPTTTPITVQKCPANALSRSSPRYIFANQQYCYEFRNLSHDWYTAKLDCQGQGGFLLSIENQDQQNFVYHILMNILRFNHPVWLGLFDLQHESIWNWVSGSSLTYTNWMHHYNHDRYHTSENCGLFVTPRKGEWDDVHCKGFLLDRTSLYPWICQYRLP